MMRTGSIRDAQYARVLSATHRRYAPTRWMRLMRYAKFPSTVKGAVPLNLVLPRVALLEPLLGNLVNVWHFPFNAYAITLRGAFYANLTARLACKTSERLTVGDTWRNDIVGAIEVRLRAQWTDREGRGSHARRFIAGRELRDAFPGRRRAPQITEPELVHAAIDKNLAELHTRRSALQAARLRQTLINAPHAEKAAGSQMLADHYDTRDKAETMRAALMRNAVTIITTRKHL